MTREEAIAIIENEKKCVNRANKNDYCNRDCYNCELVKTDTEILTALDMAIKALEQEPCEDLCKTCDTKGCIFQFGIKRKKCDFYTPKKRGMSDEQIRTVIGALTCEDAISRAYIEPFVEELENICINGDEHVLDILSNIKNTPSVTPQQKIGHWIAEINDYGEVMGWHCDKCYEDSGFTTTCKWDYCPNCGAKMEVE